MIPENVLLVCIAILSNAVRQSSAIPLNCTVTSHQGTVIEVHIGTNATVTCEISRRASKTLIEVIQCINNFTDCIRDPGILIETKDVNRTSASTILRIRNHSEEMRVSCFDPYVKAPSTHIELPKDCLLLNHTHSGVTESTNVEGQSSNIIIGSVAGVVTLFIIIIAVVLCWKRQHIPICAAKFRKRRNQQETLSKGEDCGVNSNPSRELLPHVQPSKQEQGQGKADSAYVEVNNPTGTNELLPHVQPTKQEQGQGKADSAYVEVNNPTGTNGMKDILILHAEDDADLAREVRDKIELVQGVNIRPLVDVFADVGLNHTHLSCLDPIMNEYRCILFLVTPHFKIDKIHLFQGETTLVMDLMDVRTDQQHRFVPLLCDIKRKDLKVGWLSTLIPLNYTEKKLCMQQVQRLIETIREMVP